MSETIFLVEISALDPDDVPVTLRYATHGYNDPSAPGYFEPRIDREAVFTLRRDLVAPGRISGGSATGFGPLVLSNADGALDALLGYAFDGRDIRLLMGTEATAYDDLVEIARATSEEMTADTMRITIRLRDGMAVLDDRIQTASYAGDNALPAGLAGTADDLKGKPVVLTFGKVFNVAPPEVNTSRWIFQVHAASAAIDAVYDRGVSLTRGSDYADLATLQSTAPSAGQFRVFASAGGTWFRLGTKPVGEVTADVTEGANSADRTAARVAQRIMTWSGAVATGFASADLTAMDAKNAAEVGVWLGTDTKAVKDLLDLVLGSIGGGYWRDATGAWRMTRIEAPAGAPVLTLRELGDDASTAEEVDLIAIERMVASDAVDRLPNHSVTVHHTRFCTTQTNDLDAAITEARKAALKEETRSITVEDTAVKARHPLSKPREVDTVLVDATAAATEAARMLALHGVPRERLRLKVSTPPEVAAAFDIGDVFEVRHHRFGLDAGRDMMVMGIEFDAAAAMASVEVWG